MSKPHPESDAPDSTKVKAVSVDLPSGLHKRAKSVGVDLELSVTGVYTQALELWLEKVAGEKPTTSPFDGLSQKEKRVQLGLLDFLRDKTLDEVQTRLKDLIESVGKSRAADSAPPK